MNALEDDLLGNCHRKFRWYRKKTHDLNFAQYHLHLFLWRHNIKTRRITGRVNLGWILQVKIKKEIYIFFRPNLWRLVLACFDWFWLVLYHNCAVSCLSPVEMDVGEKTIVWQLIHNDILPLSDIIVSAFDSWNITRHRIEATYSQNKLSRGNVWRRHSFSILVSTLKVGCKSERAFGN